ncbi:hypothetical protein EDB86DRAFT_589749 [Lactarius hatsudake]|nr:hypothetical protein EDB86DRAFT_589749 [Lactarius hatsudake]
MLYSARRIPRGIGPMFWVLLSNCDTAVPPANYIHPRSDPGNRRIFIFNPNLHHGAASVVHLKKDQAEIIMEWDSHWSISIVVTNRIQPEGKKRGIHERRKSLA